MARRLLLLAALSVAVSTVFAQYPYWNNYCNSYLLRDLAVTPTDIWCLADSPIRVDKNSGQITQLTHTNSPLPDNRFNGIDYDTAGNLWLLPRSGGLAKFDGTTCTIYEPDFNYYEFSGLVVAGINDIWLSSYYGLVHFDGSSFTEVPIPTYFDLQYIHSLKLDSLGRVWFIADYYLEPILENGIFCWDGTNLTWLDVLPSLLLRDSQIVFDTADGLWLGSRYHGLASWNGSNWTYLNTQNSGLLSNQIWCLAFDASGMLWTGSPEGVCSFDGSNWTYYTDQNSAWGGRYPYAIQIDDEQSVWLATNNGLVKIAAGVLSTQDTSLSGYPSGSPIDQAKAANGDWWCAFYDGLYRFDGTSWTLVEIPVAGFYQIRLLFDAADNLWLSGSMGLLRFDGSTWTHFHSQNSGLPGNTCNSLTLDSASRLWICSSEGLVCFDGNNWQVYNASNAPFPSNACNLVRCDPQGQIWVSSMQVSGSWGGAAVLDGQNWSYVDVPDFGNSTEYISDIDFLGPAVYFSTGGGLAKLENGLWTFYSQSNSNIPMSWVASADTDSYGNLWLAGASSGIARFDGSSWRNYRVSNSGLAFDFCRYLLVDDDDQIWISGAIWSYLSVFDYAQAVPVSDHSTPVTPLLRVWPNPFQGLLTIETPADKLLPAVITVHNLRGQRVKTLSNPTRTLGSYQYSWDGRDQQGSRCSPGIYFLKAQRGDMTQTVKTLLLK